MKRLLLAAAMVLQGLSSVASSEESAHQAFETVTASLQCAALSMEAGDGDEATRLMDFASTQFANDGAVIAAWLFGEDTPYSFPSHDFFAGLLLGGILEDLDGQLFHLEGQPPLLPEVRKSVARAEYTKRNCSFVRP